MKFLCLHGMGTNAAIFEAQIKPLCTKLEAEGHEFVFVEGISECSTSSDISAIFPGPYLCYYELPTPNLVQDAFDYIYEVIEEDGPFDGVFGFSQGAALASSMMLEHAKTHPLDDLFKFAVFIGASLPFNLSDTSGLQQWQTAVQEAKDGRTLDGTFSGEIKELPVVNVTSINLSDSESGEDEDEDEDEEVHTRGFPLRPWMMGTNTLLARYQPSSSPKVRIHAPTLHIYGTQDPYYGQSQMLVKLCAGETVVVRHGDGHRVPRDAGFKKETVAALDSILSKVMMAF